jgi:2,4-didehydro-3-deoxy-L-rhamnonate hydrolase
MKLLRYGPRGNERAGLLDPNGGVRDLSAHLGDITPAVFESRVWEELLSLDVLALPLVDPGQRLGAPLSGIGKIVCVGLNYHDHAAEARMPVPTEPVFFMKATSAISGPFDPIVLPRDYRKVDWEVELGVVIGATARYVSKSDALRHVAGYCLVNDVSERYFQLECGGQWSKGKSCDSFAPLGPYLVSADELGAADNLDLWLDVNGQRLQHGNTSRMIFNVPDLVHYISRFMTLEPGDMVFTGTPAGVAAGMAVPRWLQAGDSLRFGNDSLGCQQHEVVAVG